DTTDEPLDDGVSVDGVSFSFKLAGEPSADAVIGAAADPDVTRFSGKVVAGNANGVLNLDFEQSTTHLSFDLALFTGDPTTSAGSEDAEMPTAFVSLFADDGQLISVTQVRGMDPHARGVGEGSFNYDGDVAVAHAELSFIA